MRPNKDWLELLEKGIITEEVLSFATFSVNKRAKNYRDKQREYVNNRWKYYYRHDYIGVCKAKKEDYYSMKETLLSLLAPSEVHKVQQPNRVEYHLLYRTSYGSFHLPIDPTNISGITFAGKKPKTQCTPGNRFAPRVKTLNGLHTQGADIKTLVSMQFVRKVYDLILSGNYQYVPENSAARAA